MSEEKRTLTTIIDSLIKLSKNLEPSFSEKRTKKELIEKMKESVCDIWELSDPELKRSVVAIECALNQINISIFNDEQLAALLKSFSALQEGKENSRNKIIMILSASNLHPAC